MTLIVGVLELFSFGANITKFWDAKKAALNAYKLVTRLEKLNPSLEPSHAFAEAIKIAPRLIKDTIIIVNACGDSKKDRYILKQRLGKH